MSRNIGQPNQDGNKSRGSEGKHSRNPLYAETNSVGPISLLPNAEHDLARVVRHFADFDHGYLKVRRSADSADLHCTYTWSIGKSSGCYVYVRGMFWELPYLLEHLYRKVLEVDANERRPSPDKYSG